VAKHTVEHFAPEVLSRPVLQLMVLECLNVFEQFTIRRQVVAVQFSPAFLFRALEEIAEFHLRRLEISVRPKAKTEY
jgi:hypothetical protein